MIMVPERVRRNLDRGTSFLEFGGDGSLREKIGLLDGEYDMRGGVCFPKAVPKSELIEGYVVLCGRCLANGKVFVFEERDFVCVDHVVDDGKITFEGISGWLNNAWSKYFADLFYYWQDEEAVKKYRLQVLRSGMINPDPMFVESPLRSVEQGLQGLYELMSLRRFVVEDGGVLNAYELYADARKAGEGNFVPAPVHALLACLSAFDRAGDFVG